MIDKNSGVQRKMQSGGQILRESDVFYNVTRYNMPQKNGLLCRITYKRRRDPLYCALVAHSVNITRIAELKARNCLMPLPHIEQPVLRLPVRM